MSDASSLVDIMWRMVRRLNRRQTDAESAASVCPTAIEFPENDARRLNFLPSNTAAENQVALANIALVGGDWYIPPGTYKVEPVVLFEKLIHVYGAGRASILQPSSESDGGPIFDFKVADSSIENLHIDAALVHDYQVVGLTGDRTCADISISGMGARENSASGQICGILATDGDKQCIRVDAWDFVNTGDANASQPRVIGINSTADDVTVDYCRAHDCNAGIVIANNSVRPYVNYAQMHNIADNGMYNLGATDLHCANFTYHGDNEAWVEQGTRTVLDNLYALLQDGSSGAINIQNATDFFVQNATLLDVSSTNQPNLIRTRPSNTTTDGFHIANLVMISRSNSPISFTNGTVHNFQVERWKIRHHYTDAGQQKNIYEHSTGNSVKVGGMNLKLVDDTATLGASDHFTFTLPASLSAQSYLRDLEMDMAGGAYDVRVLNFAQNDMAVSWQRVDGTPRIIPGVGRESKVVFTTAAPGAGDWEIGDFAVNAAPSTGEFMFWACVSAGTPGQWSAMVTVT